VKKLLRYLGKALFDPALPLRARLFNILAVGALVISLFVCISGLVTGASFLNSLFCGITAILTVLLLLVGSKTGRYELCFFVCIVVVFFFFYPVMFFAAGGYQSGMPCFFVFAVVFTVFMQEGRKALVIALIEVVYYAGLCMVAYYRPEWVIPFETEAGFVMDTLVGMISVSVVLGITLFFQLKLYNSQRKELQEAYRNLEEQTRLSESISKAKSDFLARMSHEIRTPLNAILGFSEVELQKDLPKETWVNLDKVYHSGAHLLEIVNDILDISKIQSGNFEISPVDYDFPGFISDTVQLNIMRIGSKPVEFKLELDETIPTKLNGDELRIRQILNNLLSNAFKYTETGEVCLRVIWERREDKIWLHFTVRDSGKGIKKENLEKLFVEYAQFDTAANQRIEGTGLGLPITQGLVEAMGGTMSVESEYGAGSIFRVSLPQGIADATPIGREITENLTAFRFIEDRNRSRGNTLIRSWMPYGKALVVDDLEMNLDVMKGLLMPYGIQVDTVLSGQEAVDRIRAEEVRYDLVFMDHMMPGMDGVEAVRIIRNEINSEYARIIPIVVLTANAIVGNREMFLNSGFNDFVSKPIDIKQLDMVLNQWIRDKQNEAVLREAESRNPEGPESPGKFGDSQADAESRWLLEHPVEGVDFAAAIRLYGNSGAAYIQILKSFVTHTPPLLKKMNMHLGSSLPEYTIEVHGLKGTCNVICAQEAADLAKDLEFASREGKGDYVKARHGELRRMVLELTEQLKTRLEEWEAGLSPEAKERRGEPERALLARLSSAAGQFNSNATEEILGELERCRYENGEELIRWLREQAENFDYEAIHKRLDALLRNS
jgi:signal transduction histidine kinase/DNA-binding response OmpR family regulator/HPt (histidine-containing phosphotransfer) domain-containing protein